MDRTSDRNPAAVVAALEHLTGPSRGSVTWLGESAVDVSLSPGRQLRVVAARPGPVGEHLVGRLHRAGDSYEVEAPEGRSVWVNGERVVQRELRHGDMIEFGELGPVSRFRLYGNGVPVRKTLPEIFGDCIGYFRVSRQPLRRRLARGLGELLRELTLATTILFRVTVLAALAGFAALAWYQYRINIRLQEGIETGAARVESVAGAVARAREEALSPADLATLREDLAARLTSNVERLEALERQTQAITRVIADSMPSIAFLLGSYGFRDKESGRMLRHVVTESGVPLISPRGQPLLTLDGEGPVAELQVIGTGFFVGDSAALVTNRHVAVPWEEDTGAAPLATGNLEPVMMRFVAFLPGRADATAVSVLRTSETADLALLEHGFQDIKGLPLAERAPAAGSEIVVMGYPTGIRSLLAQSGAAFIEELQQSGETGIWEIAERLADEGFIAPLASRGIVGHTTAEAIVYDAETTHGGSGGPVLDLSGAVVAVNTAILPEFGGSNLGVPADRVRALLETVGQ